MRVFLLLIVGAALLLGGCASKGPYVSDPKKSFALNVLTAAGATEIKDIPREKYEAAIAQGKATGQIDGDVNLVSAAAVGGAMGLANPGAMMGLSSILEGGAFFLWDVLSQQRAPEATSAIFAWIPKELSATPEEARVHMNNLIFTALEKAALEVELPSGFVPGKVREFNNTGLYGFSIKGGECNQNRKCDFLVFNSTKLPIKTTAPDFLGGGDAWGMTYKLGGSSMLGQGSFVEVKHPDYSQRILPKFPEFEIFLKMSHYLPDYIYIYLAPQNSRNHISTSNGNFLKTPVILSEGALHLPVRPL